MIELLAVRQVAHPLFPLTSFNVILFNILSNSNRHKDIAIKDKIVVLVALQYRTAKYCTVNHSKVQQSIVQYKTTYLGMLMN